MEPDDESQEGEWKMQRVKQLNRRALNGNGSGTYLLQFPKTRVTEPDRGSSGTREFSIGDVEKSSGLSYTLQMNNPAASRNPSALKQAAVCGSSRRGQAGVVFLH